MITILLVLIGLALICGWESFAKSLVRPLVGLVLILSVLPYLPLTGQSSPRHQSIPGRESHSGLVVLILVASLALAGLVLWRRRSAAAGAGQRAHRQRAQRQRALPPAPPADGGGAWQSKQE